MEWDRGGSLKKLSGRGELEHQVGQEESKRIWNRFWSAAVMSA
jgi:hypothetical protein